MGISNSLLILLREVRVPQCIRMATDKFSITVKDINNGRAYLIDVERHWSADDLRHAISQRTSLSPDSLELVFAGNTSGGSRHILGSLKPGNYGHGPIIARF